MVLQALTALHLLRHSNALLQVPESRKLLQTSLATRQVMLTQVVAVKHLIACPLPSHKQGLMHKV